MPENSPAARSTKQKTQILRIKEEIKFLHGKKQHLNEKLYHQHLLLANSWGSSWQYIQETIHTKIHNLMSLKYQRLDAKLSKLTQAQTKTPSEHRDFYPRVVNYTNITFTDNELKLLNKGPKYNLHHKPKNWITNLALEAETAISLLPTSDRTYYRKQVAERINQLHNQEPPKHFQNDRTEWRAIKTIKHKLKNNNATITSADKSNALVILPTAQYQKKIQDFITSNNLYTPTTNPTKKYQRQVRKVINKSTKMINTNTKWKYINLNPSAPTIRGLIKIHKTDQPIRPIVNWRNAPAYKLAKLLAHTIQEHTPLPYTFNISNTTQLIHQLKETPITPTTRFASLDITNMYSNIPTKETKQILNDMLSRNTMDPKSRSEILSWFDTVTQQNYFSNNSDIILQRDGLAMGAPSSSTISEIFLQSLEHTKLIPIVEQHRLINYFRYVDDILIVYDTLHTDINAITNSFNALHPNMKFTNETEHNNRINFLDITIKRQDNHVNISVYRKPTYTDTIIPYSSNHPTSQKHAAVRFLYHRLKSYQLGNTETQQEEIAIHNILHNNGFPIPNHTHNHRPKLNTIPTPPPEPPHQPPAKKWCTFTYIGKEATKITKLFKDTNLQIAYRTNNTIQKHLTQKNHTPDKYTQSGIYKLTCSDCHKAYVGQTGRDFYTRFKEHKRAFQYNTTQSKFAQHLLTHGHTFGNLENTMEIIQLHKKGFHLNTIERFHIHKEVVTNNHLNEDYTETSNPIFNTILKLQ